MTTTSADLPAGRELDALVAERVMGHVRQVLLSGTMWAYDDSAAGIYGSFPPSYSSSIEAAWQVVEKLRESYRVELIAGASGFVCMLRGLPAAGLDPHERHEAGMGETAPLAICRAALLAVGYAAHTTVC